MANALKNTDLILKRALPAFLNALQFAAKVDRQFDKDQTFKGKVGATAKVRRPVLFASSDGATIVEGDMSDIEEATVSVTLDQRKKVIFQLSSEELLLNIQNEDDLMEPAMEELAQNVENFCAQMYDEVYNHVGTPGTTPATQAAISLAKQKLDEHGVPSTRCAFVDPAASNALAGAFTAVFPTDISKKAIEQAVIGHLSGFEMFMNQSLKLHTVGAHGGTPLVNGATQNTTYALSKDTETQTLITDGWTNSTAVLTEGDIFTIAGVNSVNSRTRQSTGSLQQFVVRAAATSDGSGNATLTIRPPIITSGAYQTVTAAPANDAVITVSGVASTEYPQNLAFHKNAFTLAFGQLKAPTAGVESSTMNFKGISLRAVSQYDITYDREITRIDAFFGGKAQNPGFACRITG